MIRITLILFLIINFNAWAQNMQDYYVKPEAGTTAINGPGIEKYDKRPFSENKRVQVGFSTGASFSAFGGGNLFSTWVAPEVSYKLTDKFSLKVGTVAMYHTATGLNNYISSENSASRTGRLAQYYLFAQGEYKYSNKLTLRGTTMREFSDISLNSHPYSLNHVGFDYKIMDNMTLSADFMLSKGNTPWGMYSNPYSGNYHNSFYSGASPFSGFFARGW